MAAGDDRRQPRARARRARLRRALQEGRQLAGDTGAGRPAGLRSRAGARPRLGARRGGDAALSCGAAVVRSAGRHLARTGGIGGQVAHDPGRASGGSRRAVGRGCGLRRAGRHLAQGLPLQPRAERHGWHQPDPAQPGGDPHPRAPGLMSYQVPDAIRVEADGPVRVIRLNRPEQLNASNHELHQGLAELFPQLDADTGARAAVLTGNGRAFSAGGDFGYLDELAKDQDLRRQTLVHGRAIVTGMVRCRIPIIAAVNGPAVGLGCSLVALSDVAFMAESAHLADPHVLIGLVAADGGPITWPLLTSLMLAKEYAFTGDRIPAKRAAEMGLVNHVVPDDEVMARALEYAGRVAALPQQAVEDTKRVINLHLERAVLATIDFALAAEGRSFDSPELRANLDRMLDKRQP